MNDADIIDSLLFDLDLTEGVFQVNDVAGDIENEDVRQHLADAAEALRHAEDSLRQAFELAERLELEEN